MVDAGLCGLCKTLLEAAVVVEARHHVLVHQYCCCLEEEPKVDLVVDLGMVEDLVEACPEISELALERTLSTIRVVQNHRDRRLTCHSTLA